MCPLILFLLSWLYLKGSRRKIVLKPVKKSNAQCYILLWGCISFLIKTSKTTELKLVSNTARVIEN